METLQVLNNRLKSTYGVTLDGNVKWRIVHSSEQYEDRLGDFWDRTPEGFLIRNVQEVRRVPKYPYIIPATWVLERYQVNDANPELKAKFSYEPLWVFWDVKNEPIYPSWESLSRLVYASMNAYKNPKKNDKILAEEAEAKLIKEKKEAREVLDNNVPELVANLASGSAITVPEIKSNE